MKKLFTKNEILTLAKENGIKLSYLNNLIGGYRGKMTDWKKGKTTLTNEELTILTEHLSVYAGKKEGYTNGMKEVQNDELISHFKNLLNEMEYNKWNEFIIPLLDSSETIELKIRKVKNED